MMSPSWRRSLIGRSPGAASPSKVCTTGGTGGGGGPAGDASAPHADVASGRRLSGRFDGSLGLQEILEFAVAGSAKVSEAHRHFPLLEACLHAPHPGNNLLATAIT